MELTKWSKDGESIISMGDNETRIMCVKKIDDKFEFIEECDWWFRARYSKEDAIILVTELLEWIKSK